MFASLGRVIGASAPCLAGLCNGRKKKAYRTRSGTEDRVRPGSEGMKLHLIDCGGFPC